jgi:hypothetical protein
MSYDIYLNVSGLRCYRVSNLEESWSSLENLDVGDRIVLKDIGVLKVIDCRAMKGMIEFFCDIMSFDMSEKEVVL